VSAAPIRLLQRHPHVRRLVRRTVAAWQTPAQRRLLLAVGWMLLAAAAFGHIAEDYLTNDPLARWDVEFARWLAGGRTTAATDVFRAVTFFGSAACVFGLAAVVSLALYRRRRRLEAVLVALVVVGAEVLNVILKLTFHRPRPEFALVHLDTYSFPSGHAMMSTALYGTLAYLAWGRVRTPRRQALLILGAAVFVGSICFSRLYLGVHYLSDVLAGVAGGVFWLAASVALVTWAQAGERT
jgi:undecaprenyl-diphosphatase